MQNRLITKEEAIRFLRLNHRLPIFCKKQDPLDIALTVLGNGFQTPLQWFEKWRNHYTVLHLSGLPTEIKEQSHSYCAVPPPF